MDRPTTSSPLTLPRRQASLGGWDARTTFAEMESQHAVLRSRLAELRAAITASEMRRSEETRTLVESAHGSLALHFGFEENVGSMAYLVAAWPGLGPELARLRAEHAEFLATLERAARALRDGGSLADVASTVLLVLDRLIDHELDEHQLLRRALLFGDPGVSRPPRAVR